MSRKRLASAQQSESFQPYKLYLLSVAVAALAFLVYSWIKGPSFLNSLQ